MARRTRIRGTGFRAATVVLERLGAEVADYKAAWRTLLPLLLDGLKRNATGGDHPPLSLAYLRAKARRGQGRAMFVATGALLAELAATATSLAQIGERRLVWGPSLRYAYVLHHGVPRARAGRRGRRRRRDERLAGRLPPRPWLFFTEVMEQAAIDAVAGRLDQALARAGGSGGAAGAAGGAA